MRPLRELVIFLYFFVEISGQFVLPTRPTLPRKPRMLKFSEITLKGIIKKVQDLPAPTFMQNLPTPSKFLENMLNITSKELESVGSNFKFDKILTEKVKFLLYSDNGSVTPFDVNSDKYHIENVPESIKIIIHGYRSSGDADFVKMMAKSYHSIGIKNVFSVDWSAYSKKLYIKTAQATKRIGELVGDFIMSLIKNDTKLLQKVHLIGHSLGGHISGFAGKRVQNSTGGQKIARITGLDVAAPLFEYPAKSPQHSRLGTEDANFVDSIHTNVGFFGFFSSLAHADYYVNYGGPIQEACINPNIFESFICSHSISHDFFSRTIISKEYLATSCENVFKIMTNQCSNNKKKFVMGEHTDENAKGNYYISIDKNYFPK